MKSIPDQLIQSEFPLEADLFYLNHAAVSPWPARTAEAVKEFADENIHRGAKHYPDWIDKESQLRKQLATLINADEVSEIALLKNTSEGLSVVAEGIDWAYGDNVVSSNSEFPSNRVPWIAQEKHGVEFREVDLKLANSPEQALMQACDENTRILTISSVQYGSGLKVDLEQLGAFCASEGILFCVDAIQSLGSTAVDVNACKIDFLMADAHKWMMGPEGIAVFFCRMSKQHLLELRQFGWHMLENAGAYDDKSWQAVADARRFECGSPNMLGIHALSASLSLIEEVTIDSIERAIQSRIALIETALLEQNYEILTPDVEKQRAGILTFKIPGRDMQALHAELMRKNVICAYRGGGVRLSPHFYTSEDKINKSLEIIFSTT